MKDIFDRTIGGVKLDFTISRDSASQLNIANRDRYSKDKAYMLDLATELRRRNPFGNIDKLLEQILKAYSATFKPFNFQLENIKTMLKSFEGRGVFGDQVGLGKTVQALLSALVMHQSGAIRNMLIIAPPATRRTVWEKEIEEKFSPKGHKQSDCSYIDLVDLTTYTSFVDIVKKIQQDNQAAEEKGALRCYIVSHSQWLQHRQELLEGYHTATKASKRGMSNGDSDSTNKDNTAEHIVDDIVSWLCSARDSSALDGILLRYGFDVTKAHSLRDLDKLQTLFAALDCAVDIVCNSSDRTLVHGQHSTAIDALMAARDFSAYREMYADSSKTKGDRLQFLRNNVRGELSNCIAKLAELHSGLQGDISKLSERQAKQNPLACFFDEENRLVDLVVIDEVHEFVKGQGVTSSNDSDEVNMSMSGVSDAIRLLAEIRKKYCIMLSATPLRTELEDIFWLMYISDPNRFGTNVDEAKKYFYTTVCRLSDDTAKQRLYYVTTNDNDKSFSALDGLLGMINSLFTRKRIAEQTVCDAMSSRLESDGVDRQEVLQYLNSLLGERLQQAFELEWDIWNKRGVVAATGKQMWGEINKNSYFHRNYNAVKIAFNGTLVKICSDIGRGQSVNGVTMSQLHPYVDWRRRGKCGWAISPTGSETEEIRQLLNKGTSLSGFYAGDETPDGRGMLKSALTNDAVLIVADSEQTARALHSSLCTTADKKPIKKSGVEILTGEMNGRKVELMLHDSNEEQEYLDTYIRNTDEYNKVTIVTQSFRAGVNFPDYGAVIFAQMNNEHYGLLQPMDIEQWIGRIYRTGQQREYCCIVTLLVAHTRSQKWETVNSEFLKYYYRILSDNTHEGARLGLDLYGKGKAEIAFLQPILTDWLLMSPKALHKKPTAEKRKFAVLLRDYYASHNNQRDLNLVQEELQKICYNIQTYFDENLAQHRQNDKEPSKT